MTNQWMGRVSTIPQISHLYSRTVVIVQHLHRRFARAAVLLLPASAQGLVELDEAAIFIAPRRRQRKFGTEERPLTIEHFQVGGRAASVPKGGNADGLLQIGHRILLASSNLMQFFVADESVGDFSKCALDRLSVADQSLLLFR